MASVVSRDELIRVAIVDGDGLFRLRIREILQSQNEFAFAGGFSTGKEAFSALPRLRLDFVLLDLRLPDMSGIECTRQLRNLVPSLKVIIVSGNRDMDSLERSRRSGAVAYLIKPVDPDQILVTLRFRSGRASDEVKATRLADMINEHEQAVLSKLAEGMLWKEIRDVLGMTYSALRRAQRGIFHKLHVRNRTEAINSWRQFRNNN